MNMYEAIEARVRDAALSLSLPVGWEGEPFIVPEGPHIRAKIVITDTRAATIGKNGLDRAAGYAEVRVVGNAEGSKPDVPTPADYAKTLARRFPRGATLYLDDATLTFTIPAFQAPATDGKRDFAIVNCNFYAHYRNEE
jgi:hypothetical protein